MGRRVADPYQTGKHVGACHQVKAGDARWETCDKGGECSGGKARGRPRRARRGVRRVPPVPYGGGPGGRGPGR